MLTPAKKATLGSFVGTTIEWYDFFIYGTASALIFRHVFFPSHDPLVGTLLSFATFGVAFVARPLGGLIVGHFGDRVGRRPMLVMTLIVMGTATGAIGLLPTYESIGVMAPVLLVCLRFVQGLSVGGEYGGAVLMTVEHAPKHRRGLYGSWVQAGSPAGQIIANGVFLITTGMMSEEQLVAWGWRIPFLASFALVIVGLVIRLRVEESPEFKRLERRNEKEASPLMSVLRQYRKQVILMAGAYLVHGVVIYGAAVYSLSYGTTTLDFSYSQMLLLILLCQVVTLILIPTFAHLADRVGIKKVFLIGNIGMGLMGVPWVLLLDTGSFALALLGYLLIFTPYAATYGTMAAFFASIYDSRVGYSGISMGYQLGSIFGSGLTPLAAAALIASTGTVLAFAGYIAVAAALSVAATIWLTAFEDEESDETPRPATPAGEAAVTHSK
ncbi:MHS family MFS transporter [Mycolicibacterium wolinskyi]|uniref:Putative proline/betaine transporter n=1 Tax=Mycolicibacterium wolinskyi TaxID=59750 RepID=A0A132PNJ4_9MYCO|nr:MULTISPECIES: MFS transporter [Mycolicibacterium]KWX23911.1 MFS transporter [Mycolicibacterium wolinskyi]MCV7287780.1 MHS family MFS transporter [Mycolicibacterium wolinskyi]MCV7294678.1 MHS family MFS transporter [Mycolicibacterium goodii]ORX12453.1 MFS transporter [Mycolicibacterium wolinskyi]